MSVSRLVLSELARHDWPRLRCGCGKGAGHLPETFLKILSAESPADLIGFTLDDHVEIQSNLFEAAVPAVSAILAALAGEVSDLTRTQFMSALLRIAGGDAHSSEMKAGRTRLGDECRMKVREGIWIVLNQALQYKDEWGIDIIEFADLDEARSQYYRDKFESFEANRWRWIEGQ